MGVTKLNPSIFSKVCLNFFSLLVGILDIVGCKMYNLNDNYLLWFTSVILEQISPKFQEKMATLECKDSEIVYCVS
jgi:hypothetical protein